VMRTIEMPTFWNGGKMKEGFDKHCAKRKCKEPLRNISAQMMGPHYVCDKCETRYDPWGYIWDSKEMRESGNYRVVKSIYNSQY
jgi:hypothetical protein